MGEQSLVKQFRPVSFSAQTRKIWSEDPEARYAMSLNFSAADQDDDALLVKTNVSFIEYLPGEKPEPSENPTVVVECIYMVISNDSECDAFELIAEFWPYIRSGVLVQTSLLGKDFSRWRPLKIDPDELQREPKS